MFLILELWLKIKIHSWSKFWWILVSKL